jgi:hypothetical protein
MIDLDKFEQVLQLYLACWEAITHINGAEWQALPDVERQYIDGATKKLLAHAFTGLAIAREPTTKFTVGEIGFGRPDPASMVVVSRATVETFSALYLAALNPDDGWRDLMQKHLAKDGLERRTKFTAYLEDQFDKQKDEIKKVEQLMRQIDILEAHLGIQTTDKNGKRKHQQDYEKVVEKLRRSGFGQQTIVEMYGLFSQYAHGGYLSILQVGQGNEEALRGQLRHGLMWITVALALTVKGFGTRFPVVKAAVDGDLQFTRDMLFFSDLANMKDFGERKGLFSCEDSTEWEVVQWVWDTHPELVSEPGQRHRFPNRVDAENMFLKLPGIEGFLHRCPKNLRQVAAWK